MRALLDTSVLVQLLVEQLSGHRRALKTFREASSGSETIHIAAHAVAETFSVLSTLPVSPRLSPGQAWHLINESVLPYTSLVSLSGKQYVELVSRLAGVGILGGAVYDGLHAAAAEKSGVDRLYTFNRRDFERMESLFRVEFVYL